MRMLVLAAVLGACGPARGTSTPTVAHAHAYEALRWVPADPSYVVVGARLEDVASAARELASAVLLIDGDDVSSLDRGLREEFGWSPWHRGDLESAGIDPDGGAAIFSRGLGPTVVVRVADAERLRERMAPLVPRRGVQVQLSDGVEVFSWHGDDDTTVAWAVVDGWLAVHLFDPASGRDADPLAWYRDLVARGPRPIRESADVRAARAFAERLGPPPAQPAPLPGWAPAPRQVFPNVLGVVRVDRLRRRLGRRVQRAIAPCLAPLQDDARVLLAAHMRSRSGEGVIGVELSPAAAATLRSWTSPAPPAGVQAYLASAPFRLRVGFDLARIGELARTSRCPLVPDVGARTLRRLGAGSVSSSEVAIGSLDERGVPSEAAIHLATDRAFVDALLERVPGRSAFEHADRIGDIPVVVLDVPLAPRFTYTFGDHSFTGAIGDGVMPALLAPATTTPPPGDVLLMDAAIEPGRLPHLAAALDKLAQLVLPGAEHAARGLGVRLSAYARGQVRLALEGDLLVLRLGMRLR